MGFLRNFAIKADTDRRKREALTAFYEASSEVLFLESKHGQSVATPERLAQAREELQNLEQYLKDQFGVVDP